MEKIWSATKREKEGMGQESLKEREMKQKTAVKKSKGGFSIVVDGGRRPSQKRRRWVTTFSVERRFMWP